MTPVTEERPARMLVVDDNEMNRDVLSKRLRKQGFEVLIAENGRLALEVLDREAVDVVLLDIMMPEMDGYETLSRIKQHETLRRIPVIMISALEDQESIVKCIELGAEDYLPKPFNSVILRARIGASLSKKRVYDQERKIAEMLERELEVGRRIQAGFLPDAMPQPDGWEIAARFEPARQVGGDFYDAFELQNGRIAVAIADVCDKGVGAALYMALFRSLIRSLATRAFPAGAETTTILHETIVLTNDYIADTHGAANMFATTFLAFIDPATGVIDYVNAGHESPLILRSNGTIDRLSPTGAALGMIAGLPFELQRIVLEPGEALVGITDGITEAVGPDGMFGEARLDSLLASAPPSAAGILDLIQDAVRSHAAGMPQSDDLTLISVRRAPQNS